MFFDSINLISKRYLLKVNFNFILLNAFFQPKAFSQALKMNISTVKLGNNELYETNKISSFSQYQP